MPENEPRAGYPIKRDTSKLGPVRKKAAYGRHLKRHMTNARGKILVLHATKGWRLL